MHARPRIATLWTCLALVLGLSLSACTRPEGPVNGDGAPVQLMVGASLEPVGLDPATVSGAGTPFVLLYNVYETLVRIDGEGKVAPLLAAEWVVSDDNRVYTFTLQDATFASGEKVDADAVVKSFNRVLEDPDVTDQIRSHMAPAESVEAVDPQTVRVTLKEPSNEWLYHMTGAAGIVYDPAGMADLATKPAGSGPYTFESWDTGNEVRLKRNDKYWGTGVRVDGVTFRFYADSNAMNTAMLSGDLDVISNLTVPDAIGQFSDTERFTVLEGDTAGEVVLGFNHQNKALSDLKVRQAINHAIDRKGLVEAVWGGKGRLIGSMVSPLDPWYEDLSDTYPYDPARARELLKEAGFEKGLKLRLRVPTLPYGPTSARYIAAQLKDVGIDVAVDELEMARWLELVYEKADYDMTIVAHVEPHDLGNFANPKYYWRYDNPAFARLIQEADAGSAEDQVVKLKQAAKLLADDAAADWLFLLPNLIITKKDVTGINANATNLSFDLTKVAVNR